MAPEITLQRSLSSDDNAADGVPVTERVRNSLLHNPTEKVNKHTWEGMSGPRVCVTLGSLGGVVGGEKG